jgi:DNA-binding MarR family transcriptional regulator
VATIQHARGSGAVAAKIVAALDRLARGLRAHRQAVAAGLGLTPLQLELLAVVAAGPPPQPNVGPLAAELGIAQPTVTESLRVLETKGLLTRITDTADRRRTVVTLTDPGRHTVANIDIGEQRLRTAVAALDRGDQDATLEVLLDAIAALVGAGVITDLRVNCPEHRPAVTV